MYAVGSSFWGIIVPTMELAASEIRTTMVSLTEAKNVHISLKITRNLLSFRIRAFKNAHTHKI